MAIADEQKDEIRAKIDIADLVTSYGYQLKHSGNALWCCCPFHNEKTPSFKVDSSRGTYHCFGCGESGDIFSFVMRQEGLSFGEAVKKLADTANVDLQIIESPDTRIRQRLYELMAALAMDFNKMLKSKKNVEGEVAREYLRKRKLDAAIVDKFLIGYAPKEVDKILLWASRHGYSYQDLVAAGIIKAADSPDKKPYFYFANRLIFTIKDKNGKVVAFSGRQLVEDKKSGKYINSPETLIFKKSRNFFAFDEAKKHIIKAPNREAIICEGQIDCIRLHANGFNTAIAPLGTAFTEDHAVMLHRVADTAILCFDDDGAGHKATIKTARILLAEGMPIRIVSLPDGDDPDSYILKHGAEAFADLINTKSESIVQFQIRAARTLEKNPNDSNVVVRVAKAVLETISKCTDKVLRNILLKETAKSLNIDFKILLEDVAKSVKNTDDGSKVAAEQLINPICNSQKTDTNDLPSLVEGAFVSFLMLNEGNEDIKKCLLQLIPISILSSKLAKQIIVAWIEQFKEENRGTGKDFLCREIEKLSLDEYKWVLSNIDSFDSTEFSSISEKKKMVYFARQLWHDYLVRLLQQNKDDNKRVSKLAKMLNILHTSSIKGVVHFITTFPHDQFSERLPASISELAKNEKRKGEH